MPAPPPAPRGGQAGSGSGSAQQQAPTPTPVAAPRRVLKAGEKYDPAPRRESTRSQIALILVALLCVVSVGLLVLPAVGLISVNEAKELGSVVLAPIVAVVGTALGFYFGGTGPSR